MPILNRRKTSEEIERAIDRAERWAYRKKPSIDAFAARLLKIDSAIFSDRPLPATPSLAVSREARIQVMRERVEAGEGLFHPDDAACHLLNSALNVRPVGEFRPSSKEVVTL